MYKKQIIFNSPYIAGNEKKYINEVFTLNHFAGNGYFTKKCQTLLQETTSAQKVLLTDSCTSALEISALLMRKWGEEQEVILPSYTFTSTAAAFARTGYKIIFAEINTDNLMIDIDDVIKKITCRTTAIVIVHYGGFGANAQNFKELCDKHSLFLVEDAAQAFGCIENNKHLGTIGDIGCFSFHETKNLHAGLCGALAINNKIFENRAVKIWERGTNREDVINGLADKYSWMEIGGSFYPTEMQAAFLFAQLEAYKFNLKIRKEVFCGYYKTFTEAKVNNLKIPKIKNNYITNYHAFCVVFSTDKECTRIRCQLLKDNIHAYIGYIPLHSSRVGRELMGYKTMDLPITEEYSKRILRLPLHCNMSFDDSVYIASKIIALINIDQS